MLANAPKNFLSVLAFVDCACVFEWAAVAFVADFVFDFTLERVECSAAVAACLAVLLSTACIVVAAVSLLAEALDFAFFPLVCWRRAGAAAGVAPEVAF